MESGKDNRPTPIFIFGLPRSGTTLLQKILMSHPQIASIAEPWILLPLLYSRKKDGILTEYSHAAGYTAINDFVNNLPNKDVDFDSELEKFVTSLYAKFCTNNEKYFLDKTPRYFYIIPEIIKTFPNAKFIFLFRNPLQILSSIMNTWNDGGFSNLSRFYNDIIFGHSLLTEGFLKAKKKSLSIKYDDLVINPENSLKTICNYLEIDFDKKIIVDFIDQNTKGRFGDPTGIKEYKKIDSGSLYKWKKTFNTFCKKKFALKYLRNIESVVFDIQRYNKKFLIQEVQNIKVNKLITFSDIKDIISLIKVKLIIKFKLNLFFGKTTKKWAKSKYFS